MAGSQNDRDIFEDYKLYSRIETTSVACFVIILLLALTTPYFTEHPKVMWAIILFETLIVLFRRLVFYNLKRENVSGTGYKVFKTCASISIYSAAVAWSLFSIVTFTLYGLALPTLIIFINAIGIASSVAFILSADYSRARTFMCLFILPFAVWCLLSGGGGGLSMAVTLLVYLFVILRNTVGYHNWFAVKRNSISNLNKQAFTLGEMNTKLRSEILYRKSVERALRTSEERYKTLFENNPIETIIVDSDAKIIRINSAKKMTSGRIPLIGDIMYREYGSKHENDMYLELMDSMKTGVKKEFPEQRYKDHYLHIRISPVNGGAIITSLDITEQKNAERQIQELTREIMIVQEKERKRISRDLHDSVAQELSTLRISCETFFDDGVAERQTLIEEKIKTISNVLHGSIQTVRNIAYELRPPCLDEFGLGKSLLGYCEEFSAKTKIKVDFFSAGFENITIDPEVEINIYRIVQETLNNIKKHANALNVKVRLVASFPTIILRIEDNGQGFEKELQKRAEKRTQSMGLRGMEERAHLFGGKFEIESKPGKGTKIFIEVPLLKRGGGNYSEQAVPSLN